MNVSLTPELKAFVEGKIKSGEYSTTDDVIEESLTLLKELEEQDRSALEDLRQKIRSGIEQADRGELEDVDDGIRDRIRTAGKKILTGQ